MRSMRRETSKRSEGCYPLPGRRQDPAIVKTDKKQALFYLGILSEPSGL